jgi:hypothetical protein
VVAAVAGLRGVAVVGAGVVGAASVVGVGVLFGASGLGVGAGVSVTTGAVGAGLPGAGDAVTTGSEGSAKATAGGVQAATAKPSPQRSAPQRSFLMPPPKLPTRNHVGSLSEFSGSRGRSRVIHRPRTVASAIPPRKYPSPTSGRPER